MTPQELKNLVIRHGYEAKVKRDEVLVKNCMSCGNPRWNQELSAEKGVWHSWCCQASGRLEDLLRDQFHVDERISVDLDNKNPRNTFGEPAVVFGAAFRPADEFASAKRWLHKRKIRSAEIKAYDIKLCVDENHAHANRLVFPLRSYWENDFCGYISRDYIGLGGPKYKVHIDYNTDYGYRQRGKQTHVVVEGIIDAIRVHQASFNAMVLLGTGSDEKFVEWVASVPKAEDIIILLDGDPAGRKNANRLKHLAAMVRQEPKVIDLPDNIDPGDLDPSVLRKLITQKGKHGKV